ncbi:hypothetical protein ABZ915_08440 [Streptomyces sp. NPDC046915]|uniref:hypothetical protein n=1 Tax=Streptomyces sp. NPDC046915 TaxID=3155257 RepID=UPI0033FAE3AF
MTTKAMFEDRLLAQLQAEIERREVGARREHAAGERIGRTEAPAPGRPLFTRRRLALAAGACAVAGLAMVLVPGSPADSPAYAVDRHQDGTVTFSLLKIGIGPAGQRELAERLRADGIHVTIDDLTYGHQCAQPRGELLSNTLVRGYIGKPPKEGSVPTGEPDPGHIMKVTLHPGDSLAIENLSQKNPKATPSEMFYAVKGKIAPCEPESVG